MTTKPSSKQRQTARPILKPTTKLVGAPTATSQPTRITTIPSSKQHQTARPTLKPTTKLVGAPTTTSQPTRITTKPSSKQHQTARPTLKPTTKLVGAPTATKPHPSSQPTVVIPTSKPTVKSPTPTIAWTTGSWSCCIKSGPTSGRRNGNTINKSTPTKGSAWQQTTPRWCCCGPKED